MSTTPRTLRFASTLLLSTALFGAALASMPAPASASGSQESAQEDPAPWAVDPDNLVLHLDPATGGTLFMWTTPTGESVSEEVDALNLVISGGASLDLLVRFHGTEGIVESSADGEDTTWQSSWRNRVWVELRPDPSLDEGKDYLLVFMDPSGQELPSLPRVKITTKSTQPQSPILHPGE